MFLYKVPFISINYLSYSHQLSFYTDMDTHKLKKKLHSMYA